MKKPELLLPAGSLDRLKTAFLYGADAVYCGLPRISLRAKSAFTTGELKDAILYAHNLDKKVYLTMNLFTHNGDIEGLIESIKMLKFLNPDGVIVADPGVFDLIGKECPELPRHISTQSNVCSYLTVDYWKKQGAKLCVLGREVPCKELKEIREKCPDIKLETFIHGAMCVSYSGRCLLSNFMTGRSANKGNCAHSCRWRYKVYLEEEKRPGDFFELEEDDRGTYIMNSRDLCLMPRLNELLNVGVDSLKIEGRNKSEYYVSVTARAYRKAIDDYFDNPKNWGSAPYLKELETLQNRGYTLGFFDGNAGPESHNYELSASHGVWRYAGLVKEKTQDSLIFEIKHKIEKGDKIEFLSPYQFEPIHFNMTEFYDTKNNAPLESISSGHLGQSIRIPMSKEIMDKLPILSVARKKLLLDPLSSKI